MWMPERDFSGIYGLQWWFISENVDTCMGLLWLHDSVIWENYLTGLLWSMVFESLAPEADCLGLNPSFATYWLWAQAGFHFICKMRL